MRIAAIKPIGRSEGMNSRWLLPFQNGCLSNGLGRAFCWTIARCYGNKKKLEAEFLKVIDSVAP
jgi:hypothetical protein